MCSGHSSRSVFFATVLCKFICSSYNPLKYLFRSIIYYLPTSSHNSNVRFYTLHNSEYWVGLLYNCKKQNQIQYSWKKTTLEMNYTNIEILFITVNGILKNNINIVFRWRNMKPYPLFWIIFFYYHKHVRLWYTYPNGLKTASFTKLISLFERNFSKTVYFLYITYLKPF